MALSADSLKNVLTQLEEEEVPFHLEKIKI